uniref:uncharacterized protein LOC120341648 n=1 Tax=Styela clava TaxID=7725 RepID=UPI00193A9042|nr:uncharacterized protein LOC120341648 [Styela clava]
MPRRKQDTPQRLKSKENLGNISEKKGGQNCEGKRGCKDVTSLAITEPTEESGDKLSNICAQENTITSHETMHGGSNNKQESTTNGGDSNTPDESIHEEKVNEPSLPDKANGENELHDTVAGSVHESFTNGCESVGKHSNAVKTSDDTSLLDALATVAASRSTSPTQETQKEAKRQSSTGSDSSMPIKKRGKRISTPDSCVDHVGTASSHLFSSEKTTDKSLESKKKSSRIEHSSTNHYQASDHVFHKTANEDIRTAAAMQHANQLHLMEAMMQRQRQIYEECTDNQNNNWMKMQRNDNNCLSKSKAKRYRWCVQKNQEKDSISTASPNTSRSSHQNQQTTTKTATTSTVPTRSSANDCQNHQQNSNSSSNVKKVQTKRQPNPMQDKLYGTVFTGASKFRCRDCGNPFNTLVDLTVHMSKTGHYRDQNIAEFKSQNDVNGKFAKPKKRSMMEMEETESAEKVLKCLGCGHSFDSLQDLTVHMIKTKHYEDVPSLRFYSQKNEFCASANGSTHTSNEEKNTPLLTQINNNNISNDRSIGLQSNGHRESPTHEQNNYEQRVSQSMYGGFSNLANMQALVTQNLLTGFPPYMPMAFPGAMNGYNNATTAFAAAAASLLLSAPWLMQVPGFGPNMLSPFFNPVPLPASLSSHSRQMSPIANIDKLTPSPVPASATPSPKGRSTTPSGRHTPNDRYDEISRSKSQILRCSQCGKSFSSLQKLTNHMREATHFPNATTPPIENSSLHHYRKYSESPERSIRNNSTFSNHSNANITGPSSSPLEHLAKLACGKSTLGQLGSDTSSRSKSHSIVGRQLIKSSPDISNRKDSSTKSPQNMSSPSRDKYINPDDNSKPTSSESPKTGFDFIKSLETTIQSAISKVNEPSMSPKQNKKRKSSLNYNHQNASQTVQNSRESEFKLFGSHSEMIFNQSSHVNSKNRQLKRPSSDGEEYHHRNNGETHSAKMKRLNYSPPLDLSKSVCNGATAPSKTEKKSSNGNEMERKSKETQRKETSSAGDTTSLAKNPLQCIRDNMRTWFDPDVRRRSVPSSKSSEILEKSRHEGKSVARNQDSKTISRDEKNPHKKEKTNPLKEMQKIVNATELTRRPESLTEVASKDPTFLINRTNVGLQKRSSDLQNGLKSVDAKRYKPDSVLLDLVRHENDSPPAVNPLAQMEHLVNLKIGENVSNSKTLSNSISKNSNLAKPYTLSPPHDANVACNGTNPMSALLNLFKEAGNDVLCNKTDRSADNHKIKHREHRESNSISKPPKKAKRHRNQQPKNKLPTEENLATKIHKNLSLPDETAKLRDKMADFFRSMIAKDRLASFPQQSSIKEEPKSPCQENEYPAHISDSDKDATPHKCKVEISCSSDSNLQEIQLQIIFASHFDENLKEIKIPEQEMKKLSLTTGISIKTIKEWISDIQEQLSENRKCSFMRLSSESEESSKYNCTHCSNNDNDKTKSTNDLSATDFLKHISTHINTDLPENEQIEENSNHVHQDWKMLYRGAMRFEPLNTEGPPTSYSLTAHVTKTEPLMHEFSPPSPTDDVVTEQKQKRCGEGLKVTDDSPIQVSG